MSWFTPAASSTRVKPSDMVPVYSFLKILVENLFRALIIYLQGSSRGFDCVSMLEIVDCFGFLLCRSDWSPWGAAKPIVETDCLAVWCLLALPWPC